MSVMFKYTFENDSYEKLIQIGIEYFCPDV